MGVFDLLRPPPTKAPPPQPATVPQSKSKVPPFNSLWYRLATSRPSGPMPNSLKMRFDSPAPEEDSAPKEEPPKKEDARPARTSVPTFVPMGNVDSSTGPGLANPYTNPDVLARDYAVPGRLLSYGFDPLAEATRNIHVGGPEWVNRALQIGARAGLGGLSTFLQLPPMVYSHEMGHDREGAEQGYRSEITYPDKHWWKWWSGVTSYTGGPPDTDFTDEENARRSLLRSVAGVNQEALNASYMYSDWTRKGPTSLPDAMAYFLAKTNPMFYPLASEQGWLPEGRDDIENYIDQLGELGIDISPKTLRNLTLLTTLASGGIWGWGKGVGRYLAFGDLDFEIPSYSIGGTEFSHPDFRVLQTRGGPVVGAQTMINPRGSRPWEVGVDVGTHTPGVAVSGKLYNFQPFGKHVSFDPFAGLSVDENFGTGFRAGADVRVPLRDGFELMATGAIERGLFGGDEKAYMLTEALGRPEFQLQLGLGVPLR